MIQFTLHRKISSMYYTVGELSEKNTGFRCRTIEKPVRSLYKTPNPLFVAIPSGRYQLKVIDLGNGFSLGFRFVGTYKDACFIGVPKPSDAPAGSICIGSSFYDSEGMTGGEKVASVLNHIIEELIMKGEINPRKVNNDIWVNITEFEMVQVDGKDLDAPKPWQPKDYDCIDESVPDASSIEADFLDNADDDAYWEHFDDD